MASILVVMESAGMGLDVNNVRLVVHTFVPFSRSAFMQHDSRAGRDGLPAHCLVLDHPGFYSSTALSLARKEPDGVMGFVGLLAYLRNSPECRHVALRRHTADHCRAEARFNCS
mmetsp:Transcript_27594/g.69582  ORF Transcript_27594/g.69582 Transcript_27594/m.69582 type:complete len:114 (-) Transcript_27594:7-348(-)